MLAVILGAVFCTNTAIAQVTVEGRIMRPRELYVGIDYTHLQFNPNISIDGAVEEKFNGVNPYIGYWFHPSYGIEGGYFITVERDTRNGGLATTTQVSAWTVDLMGRMPITPDFDLIGSFGLAQMHTDIEVTSGSLSLSRFDERELDYRFGFGGEYRMIDSMSNVKARGMIRFIDDFDFDEGGDTFLQFNFGINVGF